MTTRYGGRDLKKVQTEGLLWTRWNETKKGAPQKTVLIDAAKDVSWTAQALGDAARRFSERLLAYGAGERIAFRLSNGPEWFSLFLALQRAGLAAVPPAGGLAGGGCLGKGRALRGGRPSLCRG